MSCASVLAGCSGGGGGGSGGGSPTAVSAPVVLASPQSVRVGDGQSASFGVTVVSAAPPSYQWSRGGVAIAGAIGATYTIPVTQLSDDGATFAVVASNAGGVVASAVATLNVSAVAPGVSAAATTVSVVTGQPATFAVTATGSAPLTFQWRRAGVAIVGATRSTYTIPATVGSDNGAAFDVVVSNAAGTATSGVFTLVVTPSVQPPTIVTAPQAQTVHVGDPAMFGVVPAGTAPFTYQWLRDGTAVAGAQAPTYTLSGTSLGDSGATFSVVVSNAGGAVTSSGAVLTVTPRPAIALLAGNIGGAGSLDGRGAGARFQRPAGVAIDNAGNLFVSDGPLIRKVSSVGTVTTFAGSPVPGAADGTGSAASFSGTTGIAIDAAGNLYVADSGNHTIRKVTPAGVVTTLAGSAGAPGAVDGAGAAARFASPNGLAVDGAGNVFVADTANQLVRKITGGGVVTTLAGTPGMSGQTDGIGSAARFNGPAGVAVDGLSNVYVADMSNNTIRRIAVTGAVTTMAGVPGAAGATDGPPGVGTFNAPTGIWIDAGGSLYVTDAQAPSIRQVSAAGVVTTIAGRSGVAGSADGAGTAATFNGPVGVIGDAAGTLYIADSANFAIRRIDSTRTVVTLAGAAAVQGSTDATGPAASFTVPVGIVADAAGMLYASDYYDSTIRRISAAGAVSTVAGAPGMQGTADGIGSAARFRTPQGLALDAAGTLYLADKASHTIRKVTAAGVVSTLAGTPGVAGTADGPGSAAQFLFPNSVAVDTAGNVYVTDSANTIRKITPAGLVSTIAGTPFRVGSSDGTGGAASFNLPYGIAIDGAGNLYVADSNNSTVRKVTAGGVVTTAAGIAGRTGNLDGPANAATFTTPAGVAIDAAGNVYVSDIRAHTIRKLDASGSVTTVVGVADGRDGIVLGALPGHLSTPIQLTVDAAGILYCTDANGILKINLP